MNPSEVFTCKDCRIHVSRPAAVPPPMCGCGKPMMVERAMTTEELAVVADMIAGAIKRERELFVKSLREIENVALVGRRAREPMDICTALGNLAEKIERGT